MIFNDVDLLAAQFADDGLHAHAFHSHTCAYSIYVLIFGHDCDLGSLACLSRNGADHDGAVVNLRNFRLKQMLHKLRHSARNNYPGPLRGALHPSDHHPYTFTHRERLKPRLLLAGHASLRLPDVEDHVGTFDTLHRSVYDLSHTADVLVVNRVTFGFSHLLKNDLFCQLGCYAPENPLGNFWNLEFPTKLNIGVNFASVFQGHLQLRVFHLFRVLDHGFDRESTDLSRLLVQFGAQILLRLVVFARGDHDCVLHRADYNLRIDTLFPAQGVDCVVKLTCHDNIP